MNWKKMMAGAAALAMGLCVSAAAWAAPAAEAVIDTGRTGSLTVYKYDMTRAGADGVDSAWVSDGKANAAAEAAYAPYAIQGVEFTYLKVGTVETRSAVGENGAAEIELVYGLDEAAVHAFSGIGLDPAAEAGASGGLHYYESDALIDMLADALSREGIAVRNALENYVRNNGGTAMTETDAAGRTAADGLPLGLYLVVETAVPKDVVSTVDPFFVSLPMTDAEGDSWMYDVTVYPKNQTGGPDLTKEVAEVTSAPEIVYRDTATASGHDTLAYRITSNLPKITSEATYLTEYTFVDTLSEGISYRKGDVTLTWTSGDGSRTEVWKDSDTVRKFTVSYADGADGSEIMTVAMTEAGLSVINPDYSLGTVVIAYEAALNTDDSVVYGDTGNPNEVELTWKRTNMAYSDTLQDDCLVYTYGMELTKRFADGAGDLSQVKFKLRNDTDGYYVTAVRAADGLYYVTGTTGAAEADGTVFVPGADGRILVFGLENDRYTATELETDAGYLLLRDAIGIELVSEEGAHSRTGSAAVNGDAVTMREEAGSAHAVVPLTVINERGYDIPLTGDSGLFLLPVLGCLAGAALCLAAFGKRRKCE